MTEVAGRDGRGVALASTLGTERRSVREQAADSLEKCKQTGSKGDGLYVIRWLRRPVGSDRVFSSLLF